MNAVGTNTAVSTSAMATTAPLTSSIALRVASTGLRPSAILRSTFSTTTIASSTTMPIASTSPKSDRLLRENPNACITARVPISETGTAHRGMIDARQFCRNKITTITTISIASMRVRNTALIESRTKTVVSNSIL